MDAGRRRILKRAAQGALASVAVPLSLPDGFCRQLLDGLNATAFADLNLSFSKQLNLGVVQSGFSGGISLVALDILRNTASSVGINLVPVAASASLEDMHQLMEQHQLDALITDSDALTGIDPGFAMLGSLSGLTGTDIFNRLKNPNTPIAKALSDRLGLEASPFFELGDSFAFTAPISADGQLHLAGRVCESIAASCHDDRFVGALGMSMRSIEHGQDVKSLVQSSAIDVTLTRSHWENLAYGLHYGRGYIQSPWMKAQGTVLAIYNSGSSLNSTEHKQLRRLFSKFGEAVSQELRSLNKLAMSRIRLEAKTVLRRGPEDFEALMKTSFAESQMGVCNQSSFGSNVFRLLGGNPVEAASAIGVLS